MKLLIINQHTGNHGDEAAGKALIRKLLENKNVSELTVSYNTHDLSKEVFFEIKDSRVKHLETSSLDYIQSKGIKAKLRKLALVLLPHAFTKYFFNNLKLINEYNLIKSNDIIINGPGGVNLGPYQDWSYLWRLIVSLKLKKK